MDGGIKIAWMYKDILNLHGERGNAEAFAVVSDKMGIDTEIEKIEDIDRTIEFGVYDIVLFGAGELMNIRRLREAFEKNTDSFRRFVEDGGIVFATGTTGALFANRITEADGATWEGLHMLDMDVKERETVIGDDLYYMADGMEVVASQIQMIDVYLHMADSFGRVLYGYGNCGTKQEGARYKNLIFTNALGPVLVKNPWLTEKLLKTALGNKGICPDTKEPDYTLETKSKECVKTFIYGKTQKNQKNKK